MTSPLTYSGYAALLRDFICAHSNLMAHGQARQRLGVRWPSTAFEEPDTHPERQTRRISGQNLAGRFGRVHGEGERSPQLNSDAFNQLALSLFALQFAHNPPFRRFCESRHVVPYTIGHWSRIPAIPAVAFKEFELTSLPATRRTRVFHSSGTTAQSPSRHFHDAESLSLYEDSLLPWFQTHLLPEFPPIIPQSAIRNPQSNGTRFLSLTPPPELAPHSSLVHMFATVHRELGAGDSLFTGLARDDGAWDLNLDQTVDALREAISAHRLVALFGTAFSFVRLLDHLEQTGTRLQLPPGSFVLETGGYKGRSRSLPKPDLHDFIARQLGIPPGRIVSEYGMSELSSQAYDLKLAPSNPQIPPPERTFRFPPWARAQIVSPETGREVADGETGLIRVFDLANLHSVMAIQTEDLAVRRAEGFDLLGRAAVSEPRGCSLMSA